MKEKTKKEFRKFMDEQYNLVADPESQMDDAIMTLEWVIQKYEKECPSAYNEISWLNSAKESLETLKSEELYNV